MANFLKQEKFEMLKAALAEGYGTRTVAKRVGCSHITVRRYIKLGLPRGRCGCGDSASHRGWCFWRYQQSPLRQAFIGAWNRARGSEPLRWPFISGETTTEHE